MVEHSLGKGEVESSILSCSTICFNMLIGDRETARPLFDGALGRALEGRFSLNLFHAEGCNFVEWFKAAVLKFAWRLVVGRVEALSPPVELRVWG